MDTYLQSKPKTSKTFAGEMVMLMVSGLTAKVADLATAQQATDVKFERARQRDERMAQRMEALQKEIERMQVGAAMGTCIASTTRVGQSGGWPGPQRRAGST